MRSERISPAMEWQGVALEWRTPSNPALLFLCFYLHYHKIMVLWGSCAMNRMNGINRMEEQIGSRIASLPLGEGSLVRNPILFILCNFCRQGGSPTKPFLSERTQAFFCKIRVKARINNSLCVKMACGQKRATLKNEPKNLGILSGFY